jgi:hypothetical protein
LCQTEAGQIAFINALPKSFAEVVLQHSEFHSWEYSIEAYSNTLTEKDFHSPFGITTLTTIMHLTQQAVGGQNEEP